MNPYAMEYTKLRDHIVNIMEVAGYGGTDPDDAILLLMDVIDRFAVRAANERILMEKIEARAQAAE
jgi:hypothetical protein